MMGLLNPLSSDFFSCLFSSSRTTLSNDFVGVSRLARDYGYGIGGRNSRFHRCGLGKLDRATLYLNKNSKSSESFYGGPPGFFK